MNISPQKRLLLAFASLLFTWLGYTAVLFIASLSIAHLEIKYLSAWAAGFALITFVLFVLPVVSLWKPQGQIRYWYILIGASLLWAIGLISFVLREDPLSMMQEGFPAAWMPIWVTCFCICSSSLYLLLLRYRLKRAARNSA